MTPPVVQSLREQIREHIVEGIVSGRWKPGERIVERRIAVELEVSQTPVREALRELEALRLIESGAEQGGAGPGAVGGGSGGDLPGPGGAGADRGGAGGRAAGR
ncbi:hypothetical protein TPA0909_53370 [Streptomyces albus]|nr:hypothetical protein TPA0909_53370 [Streptomyces albus]